jgi:hypothetical protein
LYVFAALAGIPVAAVLGLRSVREVRRATASAIQPMETSPASEPTELEGRVFRDVA